jgi:GDP-4-dehydro-6-deoxy-D-mannose reductase
MRIFDVIVRNKLSVKKTLLVGTAAEYGATLSLPITEEHSLRPVNFYGLSKVVQYEYMQYYIHNYNLNIDLARTFNVVGEGLSPYLSISSFVKQCQMAEDGDTIYVGNLNTRRDFLNVDDVIDAYWKILLHPESGNIYNISCGKSYLIKDILDYLINKSGKNIKVVVKDEFIKKNDIQDSFGCNRKLMNSTGWSPQGDVFTGFYCSCNRDIEAYRIICSYPSNNSLCSVICGSFCCLLYV